MEKKYKIFKICFRFLLVIFLTLYFSQALGYYEYKNYQKMVLTEEQIKKFESDVKEGLEVDINNYVIVDDIDYRNSFSNFGTNLSVFISNVIKTGVFNIFGTISGFVES